MDKIRVKILGAEHSAGRGVGFYRTHLVDTLSHTDRITLVEENPDIIHYPFFDLFYPTLPSSLESPTVVTIHDLTPLVLSNLYPTGIRAKINLFRQTQRLKNISAILTDSLSSKRDIVDILKFDPERVFVTYLAVDDDYSKKPTEKQIEMVKEKFNLPNKFILYVGGVNPNKNLVRLAKAATKLGFPLILVGSEFTKVPVETFSLKKLLGLQTVHPEIREFLDLKKIMTANKDIRALGFVDNADLNVIYRLATVYCQPSLYEGFGLPVLEAMTAGCPLVCSNRGSLPEIFPIETINFDPEDLSAMTSALEEGLSLKSKERERVIELGKEKAKNFSWANTAKTTLGVYLSVLHPK